jgi:sterol desaturase/sphingolipid hydroxylase (fatty acid hydroxylase superfamily)
MSEASIQLRDAHGDWRPPKQLQAPPVFVWPPRPLAFLRWFFGSPGYLLPWNVAYAVVALASWAFLTPDMSRMRHFAFGWISILFAVNLLLVTAVTSLWHLPLYRLKSQGMAFKYNGRWLATDRAFFLFRSQLLENVFWTLASAVPVWTAYEVVTLWAQANGMLPYVDWRVHPVYCVLLMCLLPLFHEVHFYLVHRLIHWKPLYRHVHSLHHKNVNPGPWSGLSMHPVEHLLYFSGVLLHWIVPSHPLHVLYHLQLAGLSPSVGHCGFEKVLFKGVPLDTGNYMHYLHHKHFTVNYGGDGVVPIDQCFGTFHDGTEAADEMMKRKRSRARAAGPGSPE